MPVLTVIAGPNGSGKSTLTEKLRAQGIEFGNYLNADDIARDLGGASPETSQRAQEAVREAREAALVAKGDVTFETVLSHTSHIEFMAKARAAGFDVRLFFLATEDPVINLARVANRVEHGGHDVPAERVIARYHRSLANMRAALTVANQTMIFDNSEVTRPFRLLALIIAPSDSKAMLEHQDITRPFYGAPVDSNDIPVWWLECLMQIKPIDPLMSGPIA